MPTYRVYLCRPTTQGYWDWAETVVATDQNVALGWAYADWLNSNPNPRPPALSQCKYQINPVGAVLKSLAASAVSPGQKAFIDAIQKQCADFLVTQLDGAFSVVNYPAGFNYGITYGNNAYYNVATLRNNAYYNVIMSPHYYSGQ